MEDRDFKYTAGNLPAARISRPFDGEEYDDWPGVASIAIHAKCSLHVLNEQHKLRIDEQFKAHITIIKLRENESHEQTRSSGECKCRLPKLCWNYLVLLSHLNICCMAYLMHIYVCAIFNQIAFRVLAHETKGCAIGAISSDSCICACLGRLRPAEVPSEWGPAFVVKTWPAMLDVFTICP